MNGRPSTKDEGADDMMMRMTEAAMLRSKVIEVEAAIVDFLFVISFDKDDDVVIGATRRKLKKKFAVCGFVDELMG